MSILTHIAAILDRWIHPALRTAGGDALIRARLTVVLAVSAVLVTLLNMSVRLAVGDWTGAEFAALGASALGWAMVPPLLLRVPRLEPAAGFLLGSAVLVVAFLSWWQGGLHSAVLMWVFLLPMVGALLFSGRFALFTAMSVLALPWAFLIAEPIPGLIPTFWKTPADASFQLALNYTALTFIGTLAAWAYRRSSVARGVELAEAEAALRGITDASEVGLAVVSGGILLFSNRAASTWLSWRLGEGSLAERLLTSEVAGEMVLTSPGGERALVLVRSAPLNYRGRAARVVSLVDQSALHAAISERESLQQKMQEDQRLESLGLLAGGVAHDFNNLLTPILGNTALLQEDCGLQGEERVLLDEIHRASTQAAELVRQILAYTGRGEVLMRHQEVSELTGAVARLVKSGVKLDVKLNLRLGVGLPPVMADAGQLKQVVANLVTNALQASPQASSIEVESGFRSVSAIELADSCLPESPPPGSYVVITVRDQGPGIPIALRQRIFDPFFSTKEHGRGLGLASVLGIVRKLKGDILLRTRPGETVFEVLLPPALSREDSSPPSARALPAGVALVVDDEPLVRVQLQRVLGRWGWTVFAAGTGAEALELFEVHRDQIDVLLVDYLMPGMNGAALLAALDVRGRTQPAVLCTGYAPSNADSSGFQTMLHKPFTLSELAEALRLALLNTGN